MADNSVTKNIPPTVTPTRPGWNRTPIEGNISLRERPWCGKINLRGNPKDAQFLNAAGEALGMPLPVDAGTTSANTSAGDTSTANDEIIFWLGPDEWLLHCDLERTETLLQKLSAKLAPTSIHHAATVVTDYYTVLELNGENAGAVLARGCPLDTHARRFKATHCAQTRFGNASILLYKPDAEPSFHLQVRWSFTEYVWDYLAKVIDTL